MNNDINSLVQWTSASVEQVHTVDFLEFISQIGFYQFNQLKPANVDVDSIEDEKLRTIFIAGKAKMFSLEGNFLATKLLMDRATNDARRQYILKSAGTDTKVKDDVFAYVKYEAGLFHRKIMELSTSEQYFQDAEGLVDSSNLKSLIQYQLETLHVERNPDSDVRKLVRIVNDFKNRDLLIMHILGLHRLGIIHRTRKRFDEAFEYYSQAIEFAKENHYDYLIWLVKNAIGFLKLQLGEYDEALSIFQLYKDRSKSFYIQSIMTENIALIYYNQKNFKLAVDYCYKALDISLKNHVYSQITNECLFLADTYEKHFKQPIKAKYYYKLGYDQAILQVTHGLKMAGSLSEAVNKYVEFLQNYFPEKSGAELPGHIFDFALNMEWQEIKDLFQYNLVVYHKLEIKPEEDLFSKLNMKSTTYYSLQAKLAKKGFAIPDFRKKEIQFAGDQILESLQGYIRNLRDVTWEGANKSFEKDMFRFLFRKYGYQKTKLSKVLNLSYPVVVARTKELTQSIEIFKEQPSLKR